MLYIFFFNDTATTEIYTLSLHDALPICKRTGWQDVDAYPEFKAEAQKQAAAQEAVTNTDFLPAAVGEVSYLDPRSEEHTSELQSRQYLVCRLLLEKKNI